jgi:hypothetical protein
VAVPAVGQQNILIADELFAADLIAMSFSGNDVMLGALG